MAIFLRCFAPALQVRIFPVIHMRTIRRILAMSTLSWEIVIRALQLSCVMLFCAYMLLMEAGPFTYATSDLHYIARELISQPQAILLLATLASVIVEERQGL